MSTTPTHGDGSDRTTELLSQALSEEAAMVNTDPGALQSIQERTRTTKSPHRSPWLVGALGAGLATAAVITAVMLIGDQGDEPGRTPAATQPTGGTVTQSTMHDGSYDPTSDSNELMTYLGKPSSDGQVRLYAEPHTVVPDGGTQAVAAVREFLTSTPIDPDYRSGWPTGVDVSAISADGETTVVGLTGDGDLTAPANLSGQERRAAVQAIALTAGLAGGESFTFTYNGDPVDDVFGVALPARVASDDDVRAFISIDSPVEGESVTSPVTAKVSGNVFEGNVNWTLLDDAGAKVDEGFATTSMGSWTQVDVPLGDLAPGTYTLKCLEYSAEDGHPMNIDDKTFTVK